VCERGVFSICNVDSRVVKVNCFWFVACEKEQERKEGGREGGREGGGEGGKAGGKAGYAYRRFSMTISRPE